MATYDTRRATLFELRACLTQAEDEVLGGASPRVSPVAELRDMATRETDSWVLDPLPDPLEAQQQREAERFELITNTLAMLVLALAVLVLSCLLRDRFFSADHPGASEVAKGNSSGAKFELSRPVVAPVSLVRVIEAVLGRGQLGEHGGEAEVFA